jgi:hypothetical protein
MLMQVLDAYTPALRNASPSDTALLLVTVARLQHVSSYSWLQGVLDHCQDNMLSFDGQVGSCLRTNGAQACWETTIQPKSSAAIVVVWWQVGR